MEVTEQQESQLLSGRCVYLRKYNGGEENKGVRYACSFFL